MTDKDKIRQAAQEIADQVGILAEAVTEDIADWLKGWLGDGKLVGLQTKAAIFIVVHKRLKEGVEV